MIEEQKQKIDNIMKAINKSTSPYLKSDLSKHLKKERKKLMVMYARK